MKLIMYGVSKDTVSSEDIHKYSLNDEMQTRHLADIHSFDGVLETALVVTQNRNEYYLYVDEKTFQHGDLLRYLSQYTGKPLEEIILETYSKFNEDVVKHLFNITSNIEAMAHYLLEPVTVIENAIFKADELHTAGPVLNALFKKVIDFSLSLCEKETLVPLLSGKVCQTVRSIRKYLSKKENIHYLVVGNSDVTKHIVKHFVGEPDSSITFIERSEKTKETIIEFKKWLDISRQSSWKRNIMSVSMRQLVYRLSKADVVLIGPSVRNAWISEELLQDMYEMRQSSKKQLVIDLSESQEETLFSKFKNLDYMHVSDETEGSFSEEKVEGAKLVYDELVTSQTKEYMNQLDYMNKKKQMSMNKDRNSCHQLCYFKKVSHKV